MNLKQKLLFVVLAIVGVMLTLGINNALALDMHECGQCETIDCGTQPPLDPWQGDVCWDTYVQADFRYYHDSADHSDEMYGPGGFKIGFTIWNEPQDDVHVEWRSNMGHSLVIPATGPAYKFLGTPAIEYLIWFGHNYNAQATFDLYLDGELRKTGITLVTGHPKLPVIALHKMKKNADGIEMKFSAPLVEDFQRINLRIFDITGNDFIQQYKYYDISKAIKDIVPLEYSGLKARFEYRTNTGGRTLLYITLP